MDRVGFLEGGSARRKPYTYTEQQRHRRNADIQYMHSSAGIQTPGASFRAGEDCWCLRPPGRADVCFVIY
jgi:hypothetical protein